jgi:endonuclease/exonuclease/phosphatase family metal-dependent hydrolase
VGGDWNQFPPGIEQQNNLDPTINLEKTSHISHDFLPEDWTWAYDPHVPTNRSLDKPLNNNTEKAIIDYYLLSPNVELLEVKAQDLKFQHSDHQPVFLKATFK